jgi:hypothetical protein
VRYGTCQIDERDAAHGKSHNSIILGDYRSAFDLKYSFVLVYTVEANISLGALDPAGITPDVHCRQPAHAEEAHPTGEGAGFLIRQVVAPANRVRQ